MQISIVAKFKLVKVEDASEARIDMIPSNYFGYNSLAGMGLDIRTECLWNECHVH